MLLFTLVCWALTGHFESGKFFCSLVLRNFLNLLLMIYSSQPSRFFFEIPFGQILGLLYLPSNDLMLSLLISISLSFCSIFQIYAHLAPVLYWVPNFCQHTNFQKLFCYYCFWILKWHNAHLPELFLYYFLQLHRSLWLSQNKKLT